MNPSLLNERISLSAKNLEYLRFVEAMHEQKWILEESLKRYPNDLVLRAQFQDQVCLQRSRGKPLAYIFGSWPFLHFDLRVGPGVLIPRPETEELCLKISEWVGENSERFLNQKKISIVDLGAGSGCLGLGVAGVLASHPEFTGELLVHLTLVEKSELAFPYLIENAEEFSKLHPNVKVELVQDSWNNLSDCSKFNIVVSNPPYVSLEEFESLDGSVKNFEPHEALVPNENAVSPALGAYQQILEKFLPSIEQVQLLAFEAGIAQKGVLENFLKNHLSDNNIVEVECDMAGKPRFYFIKKVMEEKK